MADLGVYTIYHKTMQHLEELYDITLVSIEGLIDTAKNPVIINKHIRREGIPFITPILPVCLYPWLGFAFKLPEEKPVAVLAYATEDLAQIPEHLKEDEYDLYCNFVNPGSTYLLRVMRAFYGFGFKDELMYMYSFGGYFLRYDEVYIPQSSIDIPPFNAIIAMDNNYVLYGKDEQKLVETLDYQKVLGEPNDTP